MSLLLLPLFLLLLFVAAARPAAVSFNSATSDTRAERKRPDIHGQNVAPKKREASRGAISANSKQISMSQACRIDLIAHIPATPA
jgi:hypothetical protein